MTKKTSIIIVISIIIIIISLAISIYMPNKEKINEELEEDTSISYYLLKADEKFGVINQDGNIVIDTIYDEIIIPSLHKAVFICKNAEEETKILDNNNQEIFTKYDNVEAIELTNIISETAYQKNILKYEKDGKYGLVSMGGKSITDAKYDDISSFEYKEDELLIKENGKYGVIDYNGNQIIKSNYDSITSDLYYTTADEYDKSGYIVCNVTSDGYRYGYFDYEGDKILDVEYNQITRLTEYEDKIYLIAAQNGQYGVFIENSKIINTQYQSIIYDSGLFIVERTGKYGILNEKGIEILATDYTEIEINGIYIYTKNGDEEKVYNKSGREIEIEYDIKIYETLSSEYYIQNQSDTYSILDSNFEKTTEQEYTYLEYISNNYFIAIDQNGRTGIIDADGNVIVEFNYDLMQQEKNKYFIQAINFETKLTEIYNNELTKTLEITNASIQTLDDYSKIYNDDEEYYIDNNGDIIEDESKLEEIKKSSAILRIGKYKRVEYGVEQYYYIEESED